MSLLCGTAHTSAVMAAQMAQMPDQLRQLYRLHEAQSVEINKVQEHMNKLAGNMSEYYRQKYENDMVLSELKLLSEDATVFKKVGPCLIKQDMYEATSNVEKRIGYITDELTRIEKQKTQAEEKRAKLVKGLQRAQEDIQAFVKALEQAQQQSEQS